MLQNSDYKKYVPLILFILILVLLYLFLKPVITIILFSIILTYISYPLYKFIKSKFSNQMFSIILTLAIVSIIIVIPFVILGTIIVLDGIQFYNSVAIIDSNGGISGFSCVDVNSVICNTVNNVSQFSANNLSNIGLDKFWPKIYNYLTSILSTLIIKIPLLIISIGFILIISYFLFKDWKLILENTLALLPLNKKRAKLLISQFKSIIYSVVFGSLLVALVQGVLGAIGLYFAGVPYPLLLGFLMAMCSFIPGPGTALVWVPAGLFVVVSGAISNDYWMLGKGIALLVYGITVISLVDNLLIAKIVNVKSKVHPLLVLIGVVGGVTIFGFAGLFIGPIMLPLIITYLQGFSKD